MLPLQTLRFGKIFSAMVSTELMAFLAVVQRVGWFYKIVTVEYICKNS